MLNSKTEYVMFCYHIFQWKNQMIGRSRRVPYDRWEVTIFLSDYFIWNDRMVRISHVIGIKYAGGILRFGNSFRSSAVALYGILVKTGAYNAIKGSNSRLENQFRTRQG